jgi:hypothetical protein
MSTGPPMPINRAEFHARGFGLFERAGISSPTSRHGPPYGSGGTSRMCFPLLSMT